MFSGVARAFLGGQLVHPEDPHEDKNEENIRKNRENWLKFEEKWGKWHLLPTRDCEAGYSTEYVPMQKKKKNHSLESPSSPYNCGTASTWFLKDFQTFSHKKIAFSTACQIQNYRNFQGQFLNIVLPEKLLTVLYTNGHIWESRKSMDLVLISKESVLLLNTIIPKTHFTQNVTCSLFCESASQFCNVFTDLP